MRILYDCLSSGKQTCDRHISRQGLKRRNQLCEVGAERDEFDLALIRQAVSKGMPVLAICRGAQIMNVAFGGTLYQDIPSQLPQSHIGHKVSSGNIVAHSINIAEETLLYRLLGKTAEVNSTHHQSVKDVAPKCGRIKNYNCFTSQSIAVPSE